MREAHSTSISIISVLTSALPLRGCKTQTSDRGWIGGEFATVHKPNHFKTSTAIDNLPIKIEADQKGAALVTAVYPGSPSAMAGLQPGDLFTRINHHSITSKYTWHKAIRKRRPGVTSEIEIFRQGEFLKRDVEIEEEDFDHEGTVVVGLHFSTKLDLIPNRRFSLFALGWHMWIGSFNIVRNKRIISQSPPCPTPPIKHNQHRHFTILKSQTKAHLRLFHVVTKHDENMNLRSANQRRSNTCQSRKLKAGFSVL
jgi:hypothetical protein